MSVLPDSELLSRIKNFDHMNEIIRDFFLCLSCCNSVVISVEQKNKNLKDVPQTPTGTRTPIDVFVSTVSRIGNSLSRSVQKRSKFKNSKFDRKSSGSSDNQFSEKYTKSNGSLAKVAEIHENAAFDSSPTKPVNSANGFDFSIPTPDMDVNLNR